MTSTNHVLALERLSPNDFERLCLWLVRREGYENVQHLGASGHEQGRDVTALKEGRRYAFQCKREREFGPADAEKAVDTVLTLPESERPEELVLAISCNVSSAARARAQDRCKGQFACSFWAITELDERIKRHDDVVHEFFGSQGRTRSIPFLLPQADVSTFTGRAEELALLHDLLVERKGPRLCSIVGVAGTGGIGKSALACHFAQTYREAFPDGVIGLRVDGKDLDALARDFVLSADVELDPEDDRPAAALMQEVFGPRRALLLFDNAESAEIRALLPGGDLCAVLVTTRDQAVPTLLDVPPFGRIDLPVLPVPEAEILLRRLLGEARLLAEPDAARDIIRLVANLPLALQIVGATLQIQSWRPLADYATSLAEERSRLEKLRVRGASDLDVRASFSLSLQMLAKSNEIDFLACLSVCAKEGFSVRAAQAAAGCDEAMAHEHLGTLCRYSLLNRAEEVGGRFVFHPLLHLFARELAGERQHQGTAAERHARFFVEWVKASRPRDRPSDLLIAVELGDILVAAQWLQAQGLAEYEFLIRLAPFFERQGRWQEAATFFADFLEVAELTGDCNAAVLLGIQRTKFLSLRGQFSLAEESLRAVEGHLIKLDPPTARLQAEAMWLTTLGGILQRQGRFDAAVIAFERSYELSVGLRDQRGQAMILNSLGGVLQRQGKFDLAVDAFKGSERIEEEIENRPGQAKVLNSLGVVLQRQGKFDLAADAFQRSYKLLVQLEDRRGQSMVLNSLGGAFRRQNQFDLALDSFQKSYDIAEELGDQHTIAKVLNSLGGVFKRQGKLELAVDSLQRSYDLFVKLEDRRGQAIVLNSLGGVFQRQGDHFQAMERFRKSQQIGEELNDTFSLSMIYTSMGRALLDHGALEEAAQELKKGFTIDVEIRNRQGLEIVTPTLVRTLEQLGRREEAFVSCQQALGIAPESDKLLRLQRRLSRKIPTGHNGGGRRGQIKRLLRHARGYCYGFISLEDGSADIYFREGFAIDRATLSKLSEGAAVKVEIEEGPQGPRATWFLPL